MADDRGGGGDFMAGFIVGGLVGAVLGILFAPHSGEETRRELRERGIELRENADEWAEEALRRSEELRAEALRLQEQAQRIMEEQRGRVEGAMEEGREAAAQKKEELLTKLGEERARRAKA